MTFIKYLSHRFLWIFGLVSIAAGLAQTVPPAGSPVMVLTIEGVINPVVGEYIKNSVQQAEEKKAAAILIEMDTPGGLWDATRTIIAAMINTKIPVIVYVTPRGSRATSAGVFITVASDVAAMAPETHIGAAHPVTISGDSPGQDQPLERLKEKVKEKADKEEASKSKEQKEEPAPRTGSVMEEKMVSDSAAYIRALAAERGRNADWAEKAVRESVSLTADEALKKKVIDLVALSREELLIKIDGKKIKKGGQEITILVKGAPIEESPMSGPRKFLHMLAHPNVAYILMTVGIYGLIYELATPGIGLGGAVGVICLLLAFFSLQVLPISAVGLALIVLGILLLVMELLAPSHGLLTMGGLIAFALGSFLLIDVKGGLAYPRVSWELIASTVGVTGLFFGFIIKKAWVARKARPKTGVETLKGSIAVVELALKPEGQVYLDGELWTARGDAEIPAGEKVVVVGHEGNTLFVTKKKWVF